MIAIKSRTIFSYNVGLNFEKMTKTIFKYFRYNDNLINSLKESYLWLSNCDDFNDPFEFKLFTSTNLTDHQIIEYYKLMKKLDGGRIEKIMGGNLDAFVWTYRNFPDKFIDYFLLPFNKRVRDFGICCFSEKFDNILMWSHYADSHKGIVIEFFKDELDNSIYHSNPKIKMTVLDNVKYSNECPIIEISGNLQSTSDSIKEVVFTKSIDWKYESEIRLISNIKGKNHFGNDCIKSIYLGSRFENTSDFKSILSEYKISDKVSIYQMKEKKRNYGLEYKKL